MFVPFGEWLPDLPAFANPGALVATNVVPGQNSYLPFQGLAVYSTSLGGKCKGAIIARDTAGNYYNYVGDTSALYVNTQQSWSNVSRLAGGAYTTQDTDYWEFVQFGNRVIGVNGAIADAPQAITIGAANFAALSGAPPPAKHIATIRDFVVLGNISATAVSPQMVRWCAINNANSWTPDAATMADFQDLPGDGGWVQKIVGGEYGTIFQERAIFRMTFVGSPLIFQFDKIQNNIGVYAPQSVVSYLNFSFFLSEDGFYLFDGSNVIPIGNGKIDNTFFNDVDISNIHRVHATIDAKRKVVFWAYPSTNAIAGNPDRILIYNWVYKRWARIEGMNIELMLRTTTSGYTLDGLDTVNGSLDALEFSLDSYQWQAGNIQLGAFNASHRLGVFNGDTMTAVVETSEHQFNKNLDGLAYVTQVRPVVEGGLSAYAVKIGTRHNLTDTTDYTLSAHPTSAGFVEARSTARYHRFRLNTNNGVDFDHLLGVDVGGIDDGVR